LTFELLKKFNLETEALTGKMISIQNGHWIETAEPDEIWKGFTEKLMEQKEDGTVRDFLDTHFPDSKFSDLHGAVQRFAEGFDLADISRASILTLRDEWDNMDETQYRVKGGYGLLIDHLLKEPGDIFYNTVVKKVEHENGKVSVHTTDNRSYEAEKLVVTVSAGVMHSGMIEFSPSLTEHEKAFAQIGFGSVIKILLQFKSRFWESKAPDAGFFLTDQEIPTWWTQLPAKKNLLTGWIGGPGASERCGDTDEVLLRSSVNSLSSVFRLLPAFLEKELLHHRIIRWQDKPFIRGGYSYATPGSGKAKKFLNQPVNETIFFAGEALSSRGLQGTVESALESAQQVAIAVLKSVS
jgi:monoamine oxidase